MGLIFISHDLDLVASLLRPRADHVCRPDRRGAAAPASCARRSHPYTRGLLACLPRIDATAHAAAGPATATRPGSTRPRMIEVERPRVTFGRGRTPVHAVDGVSLRASAEGEPSAWSANPAPASRRCCARICRPAPRLAGRRSASPARPCRAAPRPGLPQAGADGVPGSLRLAASAPHRRPHPGRAAARSTARATPTRASSALLDRGRARAGASASAIRTSSPAASASASPSPAR